jgi:hypothetical protein
LQTEFSEQESQSQKRKNKLTNGGSVAQSADNQPITVGGIIKWGSIVAAFVTLIVSSIWYLAGLSSDIKELRTAIETSQQRQTMKDDQQDRDIAESKVRVEKLENSTNELNRKLDTAIVVLNRIDAKVSHP